MQNAQHSLQHSSVKRVFFNKNLRPKYSESINNLPCRNLFVHWSIKIHTICTVQILCKIFKANFVCLKKIGIQPHHLPFFRIVTKFNYIRDNDFYLVFLFLQKEHLYSHANVKPNAVSTSPLNRYFLCGLDLCARLAHTPVVRDLD